MKYMFTVSAKLVAPNEFDEIKVTSNEVNVEEHPNKIAVVRGEGFRRICLSLQDADNSKRIGQVCAVNIEVPLQVWEFL